MGKISYLLISLIIFLVIIYLPVELMISISYQKAKIRIVLIISLLMFTYKLKIYNKTLKKVLKILNKNVMINKEEMEINYLNRILIKKEDSVSYKRKDMYNLFDRVILLLLNSGNCTYFFWFSKFSLSNQALNGILSGIVWAVKFNLLTLLKERINFSCQAELVVWPSFNRKIGHKTLFIGIFKYKLGNIILMVINLLINKFKRRVTVNA